MWLCFSTKVADTTPMESHCHRAGAFEYKGSDCTHFDEIQIEKKSKEIGGGNRSITCSKLKTQSKIWEIEEGNVAKCE